MIGEITPKLRSQHKILGQKRGSLPPASWPALLCGPGRHGFGGIGRSILTQGRNPRLQNFDLGIAVLRPPTLKPSEFRPVFASDMGERASSCIITLPSASESLCRLFNDFNGCSSLQRVLVAVTWRRNPRLRKDAGFLSDARCALCGEALPARLRRWLRTCAEQCRAFSGGCWYDCPDHHTASMLCASLPTESEISVSS